MADTIFYISILIFIALFSSFLFYRREGYLISLPILFNAYSLLYFSFGFYYYYVDIFQGDYNSYFIKVLQLSLVALISFNLSYLVFSRPVKSFSSVGYVPTREIVMVAAFVGIVAHLIIFILSGGDLFAMDRVERFGVLKDNRFFLLLTNFLVIAAVMAFYRYAVSRDERDFWLAKFVILVLFIYAILTISRTYMTISLIVLIYFMERMDKISLKTISSIMAFSAVSLFFFKGVLYELILGDTSYEKFNPGEFINWIRNSMIILKEDVPKHFMPENSYILTLKSLFHPSPSGQALSEWFIEYFYPKRASSGLTYGFSGVIEGYMYLGVLGTFLHFFVIGAFFAFLSRNSQYIYTALSVVCMILMFRLFRSEIYNFVKTFSWYYLYPIILLIVVDKFFFLRSYRLR